MRPPLYITHELNEVTEPLLRSGIVDFLITQSLEVTRAKGQAKSDQPEPQNRDGVRGQLYSGSDHF
jgi:hypothetical protein